MSCIDCLNNEKLCIDKWWSKKWKLLWFLCGTSLCVVSQAASRKSQVAMVKEVKCSEMKWTWWRERGCSMKRCAPIYGPRLYANWQFGPRKSIFNYTHGVAGCRGRGSVSSTNFQPSRVLLYLTLIFINQRYKRNREREFMVGFHSSTQSAVQTATYIWA